MVEFAGVIRNSPEGQIPKASSGLSGCRRLPKPTVAPVPEGLKALKLEKLASRKTSGSAAITGMPIAQEQRRPGPADPLAKAQAGDRRRDGGPAPGER